VENPEDALATHDATDPEETIRRKVTVGAAALILRQAASLIMGLGGILLLTKLIGPAAYGSFSSSIAFVSVIGSTFGGCVSIFLMRSTPEEWEQRIGPAWIAMLVLSIVGMAIGLLSTHYVEQWSMMKGLGQYSLVSFLALPFIMLRDIPGGLMERQLKFPQSATIEFIAHATYYTVGLPLAFLGMGVWAPLIGWVTEQVVHFVLKLVVSRVEVRPSVSWSVWRDLLSFSAPIVTSRLVWSTYNLLSNTLIVGTFVGPVGVGCVAIAQRFISAVSIIPATGGRILNATLPQLRSKPEKFEGFISKTMFNQTVATALAAIAFGLFLAFIPVMLDRAESEDSAMYYPFGAAVLMFNCIGWPYGCGLVVFRQNSILLIQTIVVCILVVATSLVLVPRFGIVGFGAAEALAIPAIALPINRLVALGIRPKLTLPLICALICLPALFHPMLGLWTLVTPAFMLLIPGFRAHIAELATGPALVNLLRVPGFGGRARSRDTAPRD
jgi:PST family polysaccharide transporter